MCMKLAEFIVVNAYFMLGDQLFLQTLGIPMGANPSPAFADLYLMAYEIQFMLQFLIKKKNCLVSNSILK